MPALLIKEHHKVTFLAILLGVLPLVYDGQAMDMVLMPRFSFAALVLAAFVPYFLLKRDSITQFTPLTTALLAFIFFSLLSWLFSNFQLEGSFYLLKLVTFSAVFYLASSINWQEKGRFETLSIGITVFAFITACFGLYEISYERLGWSYGKIEYVNLQGRMGHPNLLASGLVLSLPFVLYLLFKGKMWMRFFCLAVLITALSLIMLSHSRAALLSMATGGAIFVLVSVPLARRYIGFLFHRWLLAGLGVILLVLAFFFYQPHREQQKSIDAYISMPLAQLNSDDKNFSANERYLLWLGSWRMIQSESYLGTGPGTWRIYFPKYGSDVYRARQGNVQFQRPHNDFIWVLSETGIFGLLAYLALFVLAFRAGLRKLTASKNSHSWIKAALTFLAAYLIFASFSFPLERTFHQLVLFTVMGALSTQGPGPGFKTGKGTGQWFTVVSVIALLLSAVAGYQRWQGEKLTIHLLSARAKGDWERVIELEEECEKLFFYELNPAAMPLDFYSGLAYLNLKNTSKALEEYHEAYRHHPYNIKVINNLANTYLFLEQPEKAEQYYQETLQVSYNYKEGILNLASIYHNRGNGAKAYALLRERAAVFNDDRQLYEDFVFIILQELASKNNLNLPQNKSDVLKVHYHFAYNDEYASIEEILKQLNEA